MRCKFKDCYDRDVRYFSKTPSKLSLIINDKIAKSCHCFGSEDDNLTKYCYSDDGHYTIDLEKESSDDKECDCDCNSDDECECECECSSESDDY